MISDLKVSSLEAFAVAMPLVDVFTSGGKSKNVAKSVVVRITASDGSVGISSADPSSRAVFPDRAEDLSHTINKKLKPNLIGQSPFNINLISKIIANSTQTQLGARAAIETACIDLICRRFGVSLCDYLGGALTPTVDFNGWVGELPPDEAAVEALGWVKAGFKSMKIKVGSDLSQDIERVLTIRNEVGTSVRLRVDANEQYSVKDALKLDAAVKNCDLELFEQPVIRSDLEGLAEVRRKCKTPIMVDESISDHSSLLRVIRAECADYVKFGVAQAGGVLAAGKMISTAAAAGLKVVMGQGFGLNPSTMAEIMVGAAFENILPGLECVGPLKAADTVTKEALDISQGYFALPTNPGLSVTFDDEKLARYRID